MALVLFIFMAYVARVCTSKFLNVLALQAHVLVRSRSNKNNRAIRFEWLEKCTCSKMTPKYWTSFLNGPLLYKVTSKSTAKNFVTNVYWNYL